MVIRQAILVLLAVLLAFAAAGPAQVPLPPAVKPEVKPGATPDAEAAKPVAPIDAEFRARVDAAVARAARWLERKRGRKADYGPLTEEGALNAFNFPAGLTALSYFTLLTAGVSPKKPSMKAIYRRLKRRHRRPATTYETATLLLAIDARYSETATGHPRDPVPAARASRDPKAPPEGAAFTKDEWKWVVSLAGFLERAQHGGGWRYYIGNAGLSFDKDVSATVFALMALHKMARAGYAVRPLVFQRASRFLCDLQEQRPDVTEGEGGLARGFPYGNGRSRSARFVSGGTTAAGLASLHLCRLACRRFGIEPDPRTPIAIRDAVAWLDEHWQIDRNPKAHHYHFCYLYALERIGSLSGRERIGRHPWYREGAEYFLAEQHKKTGKWIDTSSCTPTDILGTCFAILFLKRATRAVTESPAAGG